VKVIYFTVSKTRPLVFSSLAVHLFLKSFSFIELPVLILAMKKLRNYSSLLEKRGGAAGQ
jgi:hypothetical protein